MSTSTVSVRGERFSVEVWEAGSGRPTIYLHDEILPLDVRPWLVELASSRRVIAPRHPGFGRSTGLEGVDDIVDLVVYYLDFVDALGLETFDLVGESFGGMIAVELTAFASQRVRRLVLSGAVGLWLDAAPAPDMFGIPPGDLHRLSWADPDGAIALPFRPNVGNEEEQRRALLDRLRSLSSAAKFLWPLPDKGLRKRIHRVSAPTLLLWGEADGLVPLSYARRFAELLPRAELCVIPNAGHFPLLERPEESVGALKRFLDG